MRRFFIIFGLLLCSLILFFGCDDTSRSAPDRSVDAQILDSSILDLSVVDMTVDAAQLDSAIDAVAPDQGEPHQTALLFVASGTPGFDCFGGGYCLPPPPVVPVEGDYCVTSDAVHSFYGARSSSCGSFLGNEVLQAGFPETAISDRGTDNNYASVLTFGPTSGVLVSELPGVGPRHNDVKFSFLYTADAQPLDIQARYISDVRRLNGPLGGTDFTCTYEGHLIQVLTLVDPVGAETNIVIGENCPQGVPRCYGYLLDSQRQNCANGVVLVYEGL